VISEEMRFVISTFVKKVNSLLRLILAMYSGGWIQYTDLH